MQLKAASKDGSPPKPSVIVALTGLAAQRDRDAAVAAGADHYVMKPLKFSTLKILLVEWGVPIPTHHK
jgi:CheY-like chemotaxis protein